MNMVVKEYVWHTTEREETDVVNGGSSPVVTFDYEGLVGRISAAGLPGLPGALRGALAQIGQPSTVNEVWYFWRSLLNAARQDDQVWMWLMVHPKVNQFAPEEWKAYTVGRLVSPAPLPEIGGPDDRPVQSTRATVQWPTEENFREQAAALEELFRRVVATNPDARCKSVADYVATFYDSGTGAISAKMQLASSGYMALATDEGIGWLRRTYPPR